MDKARLSRLTAGSNRRHLITIIVLSALAIGAVSLLVVSVDGAITDLAALDEAHLYEHGYGQRGQGIVHDYGTGMALSVVRPYIYLGIGSAVVLGATVGYGVRSLLSRRTKRG